nr:hypothetical protein [Streptomyces somaliensis]
MGIESDQLVFDYLSRVGDLAQQRKLPSRARMGLVASLRDEIARQRRDGGADSPAAVRRILARLGTPDAVVSALEDGMPAVPGQRDVEPFGPRGAGAGPEVPGVGAPGVKGLGPEVPGSGGPGSEVPGPGEGPGPEEGPGSGSPGGGPEVTGGVGAPGRGEGPEVTEASETSEAPGPDFRKAEGSRGFRKGKGGREGGPSFRKAEGEPGGRGPGEVPGARRPGEDPDVRGPEARGPEGSPEPDWWSVVPGFTGGVEVPELLAPPKPAEDPKVPEAEAGKPRKRGLRRLLGRTGGTRPEAEAARTASAPAAPAAASGGTLVRRLLRPGRKEAPAAPAAAPARGFGDPVLLLAAGCLVLGTVTGSWLALAAGWLLAYATRRLSRGQAKWGVLGLPGAVAAGAAVWLWGRVDGRWGEPLPPGGPALAQALRETWPWTLRAAALATAAYLVWRARRR